LGIVEGFFYPESITRHPKVQLEPSRDISTLVRKLLAGRADLMVVTSIRGSWELGQSGLQALVEQMPYEYESVGPNYMAFFRSRDYTAALMAMQSGLNSMLKDGTIKRLERKYLTAEPGEPTAKPAVGAREQEPRP
jgi:ABC-type amino acid transport substrate-binding protein